MEVIKYTCWQ